jgi:uncharacterized protein YecA (UPF0149 family)
MKSIMLARITDSLVPGLKDHFTEHPDDSEEKALGELKAFPEYWSNDKDFIELFQKIELSNEEVDASAITAIRKAKQAVSDKIEVAALPSRAEAVAQIRDKLHSSVGRNSPCPCGSGKKYKKCHGK